MEAIRQNNTNAPDSATSTAASSSSSAALRHQRRIARSAGSGQGRHSRVWKACERCRMKKTKCDGEFPCQRCKDNAFVCVAAIRKKTEYKKVPRGYAEFLESTQITLIATIHKLYSMVRAGQAWELGEPPLNGRGLPVVHNIADKLGCIRPNGDIDLPALSAFPEDGPGLAELAGRLEEADEADEPDSAAALHGGHDGLDGCSECDDCSASEPDCCPLAFGLGNGRNSGTGNHADAPQTRDPLGAGHVVSLPLLSSDLVAGALKSQSSMSQNSDTAEQTPQRGVRQVDLSQLGTLYPEADFGDLADFDFTEADLLELDSPETELDLGTTWQFPNLR